MLTCEQWRRSSNSGTGAVKYSRRYVVCGIYVVVVPVPHLSSGSRESRVLTYVRTYLVPDIVLVSYVTYKILEY